MFGKNHFFVVPLKKLIFVTVTAVAVIALSAVFTAYVISGYTAKNVDSTTSDGNNTDYIKWMEFNFTVSSLEKALKYDIELYNTDTPVSWVELLAYSATKCWGETDDSKRINKEIDSAVKKIKDGKTMAELSDGLKLYPYYYESINSVLSEFVGEYEIVEPDKNNPSEMKITRKYGLKVFSPVAAGYSYNHYDDFGNSRSYGYNRKHLGNDIMGNTGTPIIAVEGGKVEALGWNQYGGWRIGIRSFDGKRYYYYAHLRKDHPFVKSLKAGDEVNAGDVIGYLGMTGYSSKENVNNIKIPHLHFGVQIIFNEVQKESNNQIWINLYALVDLLAKNKMPVVRDGADFIQAKKINTIITD